MTVASEPSLGNAPRQTEAFGPTRTVFAGVVEQYGSQELADGN